MNVILQKAKIELKEIITVAHTISDGKVSIGEKIRYLGLRKEVNLKEFIPVAEDMEVIPQFEDLDQEQLDFLTDGDEEILHVAELAYNSVLTFYEGVAAVLSTIPNAQVVLPTVATDKSLVDVTGLGEKLVATLESIGIKTVEALANADVDNLKEALKTAKVHHMQVAKVADFVAAAKTLLAS